MQTPSPTRGESKPFVFVSYAHADKDAVMHELSLLERLGVDAWFDEGITPGNEWREDIAQAIANATRMIFFVTQNSVNSKHCLQEASFSHNRGINILAIHLEPTDLSLGLELSLGDQQAILKYQLDENQYIEKLNLALAGLITRSTSSEPSKSEHKQVTSLYAQFRATAPTEEPIDPESYHEALSQFRSAVTTSIVDLEGHVSNSGNDELVVYFGVPRAHEDDSVRAVRAALRAMDTLIQAKQIIKKKFGFRLEIYQGIQCGRVVVKSEQDDTFSIFGHVSNDARDLAKQAKTDEIKISETVYSLVNSTFECEESHEQVLSSKPIKTYRVVSNFQGNPKGELFHKEKIVGRQLELDSVLERWRKAEKGSGQATLLSGEPGIGKSRLTTTLVNQIHQEGGKNVICGFCSPYLEHTMLHPFVRILEDLSSIHPGDNNEEKLKKLETFLSEFRFDHDGSLRLFANLLNIPNDLPIPQTTVEREKQLLLETILSLILQFSEKEPLLLVVEDLHWADQTTLELLGELLDVLSSARVFCLLNYRSHFNPGWVARPYVGVIALNNVSDNEARKIVLAVLGGENIDGKTLANIISRADGVPLFLEEVTKSLMDSGVLTTGAEDLPIPITLQESLNARLDFLKVEKLVAQIASVIGRDFDLSMLAKLVPYGIDELNSHLKTLVRKEFVAKKGIGALTSYSFRHALIRDTAYESLVRKDRNKYHKCIADLYAKEFTSISDSRPELPAHHYSAYGDSANAIEWWMRAGEIAANHSANKEAEHHYSNAMNCISGLEENTDLKELEILMRLVPTYVANYGYGASELERSCNRAMEICETFGDSAQTAFVLFGLWMFNVVRANHQQSLSMAERVAETAQTMQNPDLILEAALAQGIAKFFTGDFANAQRHFDTCVELYDDELHGNHAYVYGQDPRVVALSYLSWLLWITGDDDRAVQTSELSLKYARELDHPVTLAFSLSYAGFLRLYQSDFRNEHNFSDELVAMYDTHGTGPVWLAHGKVAQAWRTGEVGDATIASDLMQEAIALFRQTGSRCFLPLWDAIHAELLLKGGQSERALAVLENAKAEMQVTGESWCLSEWHRVYAQVQQSLGNKVLSAESLENAANVAARQGAKNWLSRLESS